MQDFEKKMDEFYKSTHIDHPNFEVMAKQIISRDKCHDKVKHNGFKRMLITVACLLLLVFSSAIILYQNPKLAKANNFLTAIEWFKQRLNGHGKTIQDTELQKTIWKKMFFAIKNYQTLQGTVDYNLGSSHFRTQFAVKEDPNVQAYEDAEEMSDRHEHDIIITSNGHTLNLMTKEKQYSLMNIPSSTDDNVPSNVHITFPNMFSLDDHSGMGPSRTLTNPHELLHGLLDDFSTWQVNGSSSKFERNVYDISGTASAYRGKFNGATDFKMMVDQETGVILEVDFMKQDKIVSYVKFDTIEFNKPISNTSFDQSIPSGYTKNPYQ